MRTTALTFLTALSICAAAKVSGQAAAPQVEPTPRLERLDILHSGWPRVFFFRSAEGMAIRGKTPYETWDATFSRLQGIEGKVLAEENANSPARRLEFFTRFKEQHPTQLTLLHYNGIARLPEDATQYFAGHWLYYNGAKVQNALPASAGEETIEVDDARLFKTNTGRNNNSNEAIGLCELDAQGRPDWSKSEQVRLLGAEITEGKRGKLRVLRGQYGTKPRAFASGQTYAAAHAGNGPWGRDPELLWVFNLATTCPRDSTGRTCADVFAAELAADFAAGGPLEKFDGIEFDVLRHSYSASREVRARSVDADADGVADSGYVGGQDVYGAGTQAFCRELRRRLGPDRLILADGWSTTLVRAFDALNGMESEGWPRLGDALLADWCGGLNRAAFWAAHSAAPRFNYINHKLVEKDPTKQPGYAYHRLVFAGAMFTDSAICSSLAPPVEGGEMFGVWDEFWGGTEHRLGWLGQPLGPARHLAFSTADLLAGAGSPITEKMLPRLASADSTLTYADGALRVAGKTAAQPTSIFTLTLPVAANGELLMRFTVQSEASAYLPPGTPRALHIAVEGREEDHTSETWSSAHPMEYTYYATGLAPGEARVIFTIEGTEPWRISAITTHAAPDAMLREYEHGVVLANPSDEPFTFDLAALVPGAKFTRLSGSEKQDTKTNNGAAVESSITLQPRDGLFLRRR